MRASDAAPPVGAAELRASVGELSADSLLASVAVETQANLWLPCDERGPVFCAPSAGQENGGVATLFVGELRPVTLAVLAFSAAQAIDLLTSLPEELPGVCGDSIRYWAALSRFLIDLMARRQFVPHLDETAGGFVARWRPVVQDRDEIDWLERCAAAMPYSCRAMVEDATDGRPIRGGWSNRILPPPPMRWCGDAWRMTRSFGCQPSGRPIGRPHPRPARRKRAGWRRCWVRTRALAVARRITCICRSSCRDGSGSWSLRSPRPRCGWFFGWRSLRSRMRENCAARRRADRSGARRRYNGDGEADDGAALAPTTGPMMGLRTEPAMEPPMGPAGENRPPFRPPGGCICCWNPKPMTARSSMPPICGATVGDAALLGRSAKNRQARLVAELTLRGANVSPAQPCFNRSAPFVLSIYKVADAYAFIRQWTPVLRDQGFGVALPTWADRSESELGLRLNVRPLDDSATPGRISMGRHRVSSRAVVHSRWNCLPGILVWMRCCSSIGKSPSVPCGCLPASFRHWPHATSRW